MIVVRRSLHAKKKINKYINKYQELHEKWQKVIHVYCRHVHVFNIFVVFVCLFVFDLHWFLCLFACFCLFVFCFFCFVLFLIFFCSKIHVSRMDIKYTPPGWTYSIQLETLRLI